MTLGAAALLDDLRGDLGARDSSGVPSLGSPDRPA